MRLILVSVCVLASVGTASAQGGEPRPFVFAEPSFRATNRELTGVGNAFGLDLTVGTRSWRGLQPIFQGGRLIDVTPADLIRRSPTGSGYARQTNTWYGAAGVRFLPPRAWRFQPYLEGSGGVAHMDSEVVTSTDPIHASLLSARLLGPMSSVAAGSEIRLGQRFTIDAGYSVQNFFDGDASVGRRGPRLAFGVRF